MKKLLTYLTLLAASPATSPLHADPCGMVPPIWLGEGRPIERIGLQQTYVFYKDGIESLVLRPGFEGRVEEFGMLIPFPSSSATLRIAGGDGNGINIPKLSTLPEKPGRMTKVSTPFLKIT